MVDIRFSISILYRYDGDQNIVITPIDCNCNYVEANEDIPITSETKMQAYLISFVGVRCVNSETCACVPV